MNPSLVNSEQLQAWTGVQDLDLIANWLDSKGIHYDYKKIGRKKVLTTTLQAINASYGYNATANAGDLVSEEWSFGSGTH